VRQDRPNKPDHLLSVPRVMGPIGCAGGGAGPGDTITGMESVQVPVVEVDVVAFVIHDERLDVLLVRRATAPFAGRWALPGVRLAGGERLADAACRALQERTGLEVAYLEQLFTFDDPARDPRGRTVSVAYYALLPVGANDVRPGRAVEEVAWWPAEQLPPLAFDHADIAATARRRVAAKTEYAPIAFSVLPERFSMRQLRAVHEVLTGQPYAHENNFARQMTNRWHLKTTGEQARSGGRPATLYRFVGDSYSRQPSSGPG
jgi:8-oxo-dGTP diphosphatase